MTDRANAPTERARACPFVAFEDDRDERSDRPDHRHRCYAETRPAPRAIAHQEAFCLSASFPACPTFQDWARREAAHAASVSSGGATAAGAGLGAALAGGSSTEVGGTADDEAGRMDAADGDPGQDEPPERTKSDDRPRNPSRDWAAPPTWLAANAAGAAGSGAPGGPRDADADAKPGMGLAASRWLADVQPGDEIDAEGEADESPASSAPSFLAGRAASGGGPSPTRDAGPDGDLADLVSRNRPAGSPVRRDPRPMAGQQRGPRKPPPRVEEGPSWERPHRFEAYPTLKSRVGMPAIPRLGVAVAALVVAAVLLFMIPALFFGKNEPGATPSPSQGAAASVSLAPTVPAVATPVTYTIKAGDNLLKIAKAFGVTQAQILAANPKIKDPNKISIGQVIVIPVAIPTEIIDSTSPSPGPS